MRVMYISQTLGKGGSEKQLSSIADRLRQYGYISIVVALSGGGWWASYLKDRNIPVSILDFPPSDRLRYKTLLEFCKLILIIRRHKPDIVISFLYSCSIWASIAARLAGVPVVIAGRRDCGFQRMEAPLPRWLEKLSYLATTKFIANSLAVAKSLQQYEGISYDKIEIIYNGMDFPTINSKYSFDLRKKLEIPESTPVVCMVANFWPHKNHLMLVRAAKLVVAQHHNVIFLLKGRYWDYQKQVEAEITKLGLKQHFRIVEEIDDVHNLLPLIDIGILCSDSEGFSNTILEYMAFGNPVIATCVGGNPEAVTEGENGYLIELGNTVGLADAILTMIRNPDKRTIMGKQARTRVESEFNWDVALKRWNKVILSLF